MEVVVGTYDEVILGYKLEKAEKTYSLNISFTDHSHLGCVKCIAISRKGTLASGSTDETIRLLNLKKRTELGALTHHSGTITSLDFFKSSHLFSASEDGTIGIWKYYTWECIKTLKGHKGAINDLSIHPSGKLALSVGRDKVLKAWNLLTGKAAYTTALKQEAELVSWSPEGTFYAIAFPNRVDVYSTETAEVISTVSSKQRINCLSFLDDDKVVYGGEGGTLNIYSITQKSDVTSVNTETNRIKGFSVTKNEWCEDGESMVFTASSDGFIRVYLVQQTSENDVKFDLLTSMDTKFRLTCLSVYDSLGNNITQQPAQQSAVKSKATKKNKKSKSITNKSSEVAKTDDSDENNQNSVGERLKVDYDVDEKQSDSDSKSSSKGKSIGSKPDPGKSKKKNKKAKLSGHKIETEGSKALLKRKSVEIDTTSKRRKKKKII